MILLVIILLYSTISINSRFRRYVDEDKEQLIYTINSLIIKSKGKIDSIISNIDEAYIEYEDIQLLMMYHDNLDKSLFGFKKKAYFINNDISTELQDLCDKYKFAEKINLDNVREYYKNLLTRIESGENIMLKDDDVYMLESIYNLYNQIRESLIKIL
ncbi:MAG: hypothetical protein GX080_01860 [Tissierellia bacterium]|nr:hypothetical protein [Tissierellia bacterium]